MLNWIHTFFKGHKTQIHYQIETCSERNAKSTSAEVKLI